MVAPAWGMISILAILVLLGLAGGIIFLVVWSIGRLSSKERSGSAAPLITLGCLVPAGLALLLGVLFFGAFTHRSVEHRPAATFDTWSVEEAARIERAGSGDGAVSAPRQGAAVETPVPVFAPRQGAAVETPVPVFAPRQGAAVETAEVSTRRQEPAYVAGPDDYKLHLPDDLEAWKRMDEVAPPPRGGGGGGIPAWVADAAGSEPLETGISGYDFTSGDGRAPGVSVHCRRPGPQGMIAGYSRQPEPDPAAARAAARRSAADQLRALVFLEILRNPAVHVRDPGVVSSTYAAIDAIAVEAVRQRLERDQGLIAGGYDQEFPMRTTGAVMHRSAVLVRADEPTLQSLVADVRRKIQEGEIQKIHVRRKIITTVASTAGLAFFIFLLYALLNAGTKGHFAWPLRFISLTALVLLSLGILYLQGWLR